MVSEMIKHKIIKLFFLFVLFIFVFISCVKIEEKQSLEEMINNNEFSLVLKSSKTGNYCGSIFNENGNWGAYFGGAYRNINFIEAKIIKDSVIITYLYNNFYVRGEPSFRDYVFPVKYSITLTHRQIENRIEGIKDSDTVFIDLTNFTDGYARGLVITDNLRIRKAPGLAEENQIIGMLKKFDDIFLVETTLEEYTIEGLTAPWYKIEMMDGTYGWVFGGFVKLYFYNEDIEDIKKVYEKEGSEYAEQEIHQDD